MEKRKLKISAKIEVYEDNAKEWRWKITVPGNTIGSSSEGYKNKSDCIQNLSSLANILQQYLNEQQSLKIKSAVMAMKQLKKIKKSE